MTVDDIVNERLGAGCAWLDTRIIHEMRELVLAAGDRIRNPTVSRLIDEHRERLERRRDERLDELRAELLRELHRMH